MRDRHTHPGSRARRSARRVPAARALALLISLAATASACGSSAAVGEQSANVGASATTPASHNDGHDHQHGTGTSGTGADPTAEGHVHTPVSYQPLDSATQKSLTSQLAQARQAAMQYPTVKDFMAAGGQRVGFFAPGSGAHYSFITATNPMERLTFDPAKPLMLLYAGNDDTSPVVGAMYLVLIGDSAPEGFAGPNDEWHQHKGACMGGASKTAMEFVLPIDKDASKEQCDAAHGAYIAVSPWMVHVWLAPGWESPDGVFSHDNPLLICRDGTSTAPGDFGRGCKGLA